jgi:uncharacterized protein
MIWSMDAETSVALGPCLFGKVRRNTLAVLFGHPQELFYTRQLARSAGVAVGAIQRELSRLQAAGIVNRSVRGNQVCYQANPTCSVFAELRGLIVKTAGVAEPVRDALASLSDRIRVAFVYGSAARGELNADSDIDLMIVGDVTFAEVVEAFGPVQDRLGREVNPTVYSTAEFLRKMAERHHFVSSVVREPKIFLVGDERELAGLVEERMADRAPAEPSGDSRSAAGGGS